MECRDYQRLANDLLDGELDAPTRHLLGRHLAECEACAREYAEMQAAEHWARSLPLSSPRADFADRVMARIAATPAQPSVSPLRAAPAIAGIVAFALIAGWLQGSDVVYDWLWQAGAAVSETSTSLLADFQGAWNDLILWFAGLWNGLTRLQQGAASSVWLVLIAITAAFLMAVFNFIQARKEEQR